ncbi:amyloid fiber anchoring/assembly protein TapA [Fictibacillus iocasae]|uniref:Amyloid fiber anchoring/assembly protein TapA n=1 Tax=Fictibacillus iocasae TaxID=2715437 RepID=A0ABW2NQ58_9BACL
MDPLRWEGTKIRSKRLRKFRNKHYLYISTMKIGVIFYSLSITLTNLTGSTNAYFNDTKTVTGSIEAGVWEEEKPPQNEGWDKSSLQFGNVSVDKCTSISAEIQNRGNDMKGSVTYEVWFALKGNPKDGQKLAEGVIEALKEKASSTLSFEPQENGIYKFKAYQRSGHPGKGELWSEQLSVTECTESSKMEPAPPAPEVPSEPETPSPAPEEPAKPAVPADPPPSDPPAEGTEKPVDPEPADPEQPSENSAGDQQPNERISNSE